MSPAERSNPKRSTWCDLAHRAHKTNGSLWSLSQLEERLKCGPSWTLSSLWIAMPALPCFSQWNAYPPSKWLFLQLTEKTGGFHLEFSVGGESVVFPLFPEKGQSVFPPWHCVNGWHVVFRSHFFSFSQGAQPKLLTVPVSGHLWCWQQLGTKTSHPLKSWNCPISRSTDLLLDLKVLSLSFSSAWHRWNTGTTPLCGTQRCWSTWPSTMQSAPSTRSATLSRTEATGSPCSTAAPTETSFHKGKPLQ